MKSSYRISLWCLGLLSSILIANAQTSNVTFKSTITSSDANAIPSVYVKIYSTDSEQAVDSLFSDDQGKINKVIPFYYQSGSAIKTPTSEKKIIIREISPNIISQPHLNYELDYLYAENAQLHFVNVEGKSFPNHSELASGMYIYYLSFEDGSRSEYKKLLVAEKQIVSVRLNNLYGVSSLSHHSLKSMSDDYEVFYVEFIKDGYVTKRDTIEINNSLIEKNYSLSDAPIPTAEFLISGSLLVGEAVLFDATASVGANSEELIYSWDFGDGKKGQSVGIPHLFDIPGEYTVTLTVAGDYGAKHSSTQTITIAYGTTAENENGSILGIVNDEAMFALSDVTVSLIEGSASGNTNTDGQIELTDLPVGIPVHFALSKSGYVNQVVELTIPNDTVQALFYVTLKAKGTVTTISNVEFGGEIEGDEGTLVNLPVAGLKKQDGSPVTGDITVSITPVDVANEPQSFPGTFNAYRQDGEDGVLLSYGVSDFTFKQGTEKLQLAEGKTATIVIPIYTSGAIIGDEIALWSVNETNGSWVQEGSGIVIASDASPTGLALEATVGHFSWWNCDDFADDEEKKGRCYKWICDDYGYCTKAEVPCWVDGKRNPGTEQNSIPSPSKLNAAEDIPPVFEVRDYIPSWGKTLIFPANRDTYIRASHRDEEGEYYRGEFIVLADSELDSFEIELSMLELEDTLNLPLNTIVQNYFYKRVTFTADIPSPKLYYLFYRTTGQPPFNNGIYEISDSSGILSTGDINDYRKFVYPQFETLKITIDGETLSDEGYYQLGLFEPDVIPLSLNDSIGAVLTPDDYLKHYGIRATNNTVATIKYYEQDDADGGGLLRFISPIGEELQREGMYLTPKSFTTPIRKDSTYILEIDAYTESTYGYIVTTKEEEHFDIAYGDTVDASLANIGEIDMYKFCGEQGDIISLLVSHPYGLNQAKYELWDENGNTLGERQLRYGTTYLERQEIVIEIPKNGEYSILVYCEGSYTGDYQVILNQIECQPLTYNACNVFEPAGDVVKYFEVDIPENKNTCFSLISFGSSGYGYFDIHNNNGQRVNDDYHRSFYHAMYYSYVGSEPQGKYFLKVTNNNASSISINIFESTPLNYNDKGLAQIQNSFDIEGEVNVYQTNVKPGDGIHAIMNTVEGQTSPGEADIYFYPLNGGGDPVYLTEKKIHYYTLDSTILIESCGKAADEDTTWIVMATGGSTGHYNLSLHKVEESSDIIVDDDFMEYPGATTSSIVAAGYAIEDNGTILIANGDYFAYSPMLIERDSVELHGQDKDNIMIASVWNYSNTTCLALDFRSTGGHLHDLTFSNGDRAYSSVAVYGDDIIIEDIDVEQYDENIQLDGQLKLNGNNLIVRNIYMEDSYHGIQIGGNNNLVENCTLQCEAQGIQATGSHFTIKNNTINLSSGTRAIYHTCGQGQGSNVIDSNLITVNYAYGGSEGIINAQENGRNTDNFTTYVRENIITTTSGYYAMMLTCGNAPSKIIAENNKYTSTYSTGGKAVWLYPGRTDGASSILVRNNTFDGLSSESSINISYPEYLSENEQYGVYNNSFRFAAGAEANASNGFIQTYSGSWTPFADTAAYYFINNIFEGNGVSHLVKCNSDLSFYSDYNVVYNFGGYVIGENGTLIGTTNDQSGDPLFIDDDLHINTGSSAINNGASPTLYPLIPTVDKDGTGRPLGGAYDIGAYERE